MTYSDAQQQQMDKFGFSPGENFGKRYRVIEEIGRGGMGIVYKAEDKELGIRVALKMIRPAQSQNPRFIERFRKETLLARSISHENIIRVYDLGEIDEIKYISMEYIKGQNLKELINASGSLTIETCINISKQICDALRAAHNKGIIHQDLKPQNIMIDGDGNVHIMDFGVARVFEEEETSVFRGITGTPPYLSPERAKGEKADQRSDIYSFGIIMFEMLTGKRPFEAETMEGYIHKHLYEKPPTPSKQNPRIPSLLDKIILKCLEKEKEKRYQNVQDILIDLEKDVSISMPVDSRIGIKKSRAFIIAACIVFIIFLGYLYWKGRKKEALILPLDGDGRISVAVMYFENNTGDKNLDHWRFGLQEYLMTDLAQSRYLRVLTGNRLTQNLNKMDQFEAGKYSSRVLDRIASEENIQYFILGSIGKAGDNYRVTFKIQEAFAREFLATEIKDGKEQIFHSIIDETTEWIKGYFLTSDQIASDIDREIGKISTSSPKAQEHYFEGINYARERKFEEAIQSFKKAVDIDPEFAMAYKQIAANYNRLDMPNETEEYFLKALELGERISVRERYLIEASYLNLVKKDYDQAINKYLDVLKLYPEDDEAKLKLGAIYFNIEEWDRALEYYNQVPIFSNVSYEAACINIAYIYMAKGWYNQARIVFEANKELFSSVYCLRNMSHTYLYEGKYERALQEIDKAISKDPDDYNNIALLGNIYHVKGDLFMAEKTYQKLKEADDELLQGDGRHWMSKLFLVQGKYKKCLDETLEAITHFKKCGLKSHESNSLLSLAYANLMLDRFSEALNAAKRAMDIAVEIHFPNYQKWALHLQGLAYLKMNNILDAEKTADQLNQLIDKTRNKKHLRHYYHLMGMIDLQKNKVGPSIEKLTEAVLLMPKQVYGLGEQAFYIESLASACYKNGNFEESKSNYEKISNLTWGRIEYGDIYAKSFYWIGKINQKLGLTVQAKKNYKIFLDLWKEADPGDAEVADAKKQYEVLILN